MLQKRHCAVLKTRVQLRYDFSVLMAAGIEPVPKRFQTQLNFTQSPVTAMNTADLG
jgi:hypothetical protein